VLRYEEDGVHVVAPPHLTSEEKFESNRKLWLVAGCASACASYLSR
jgi:hypothetical protein